MPLLGTAVVVSGALEQPNARPFFAGLLGALATVYALTDWDAQPPR